MLCDAAIWTGHSGPPHTAKSCTVPYGELPGVNVPSAVFKKVLAQSRQQMNKRAKPQRSLPGAGRGGGTTEWGENTEFVSFSRAVLKLSRDQNFLEGL